MKHRTLRWTLSSLILTAALPATAREADPATAKWMDAVLAGKSPAPPAPDRILTKGEAAAAKAGLWSAYKAAATRAGWDKHLLPVPETIEKMTAGGKKPTLRAAELKSGDKTMPYTIMAKGEKPAAGWPMFICMHGGGMHQVDTAHGWEVNTREWQAQMSLTGRVYQPAGLYFIPRMADDRLGRWWHKHNIDIFTRVIRDAILFNDVDPNKIYLMGISQGGYGTCHLSPFLADLLAGGGSMAGGMMTETENLRNVPFRSDIGEHDTMYKRIELAKELHESLDALKAKDPGGYENVLAIQKGRGHGIDYSQAPSWLVRHTRNPHPRRIVWRCYAKDGVYRDSFYWLSLQRTPERGEFDLTAAIDKGKNLVTLTAEKVVPAGENKDDTVRTPLKSSKITVHLADDMLDLNRPVTIVLNGKQVFSGKVKRSRNTMMKNLVKRGDPNYAFPAEVTVGG